VVEESLESLGKVGIDFFCEDVAGFIILFNACILNWYEISNLN
jgi:hypothetical protein